MSGISNVLSGFVQLSIGSTQLNPTDLKPIENNSHPVTISFAPRSTIPELNGNIILDSTAENTCTYKGNVYQLVNVQICSPMNTGYQYTGNTSRQVAELIITFKPKPHSNTQALDGILLCLPIYSSGTPNHNEYLTQLIDPNMPACNYTNTPGTKYTEGMYKQGNNSTLLDCVISCCNDPNCISYNFNDGRCSLHNKVSSSTTANSSDSSGMINRGAPANNTTTRSAIMPTLQTVFYNSNVDTSQTSLAYVTTFDTVDANNQIISTKSLFIVVFPVGINMVSAAYEQLLVQIRSKDSSIVSTLPPYYVPSDIRNDKSTVKSFRIDTSGNKIPVTTSNKGEISVLQISNCDETFKTRFEWFTKPPLLSTSKSLGKSFNSEKCPYYKTSQYKCVPFDQLHDLSGNNADPQDAYVIPGNVDLKGILNKNQPYTPSYNAQMKTTEDIITYGAMGVVCMVGCYVLYRLGMKIKEEV